jgi:hypothetical protein
MMMLKKAGLPAAILHGALCIFLPSLTTFQGSAQITEQDSTQAPDWVHSVQLSATVQTVPPQITLHWEPDEFGANNYTVYRKTLAATSWGSPIANLGGSALDYTDPAVTVGSTYEYQVIEAASQGYLSYGYIYSGVNASLIENRGKLILLVATNATASLSGELARLQTDLIGDGWQVIRHDVSSNDTPAHARSLVVADYNADPANVTAVFLFGHVPILQSGFINYDGHGPRAMPSDGYYGDMNGDWSGSPSYLPSDVELMVGRVDLADMPGNAAPGTWPNETELLRNYLNKDHRWRFKQFTAPRRALVAERFGTLNGETRASSGFRNLEPLVGPGNTLLADISDTAAPSERWISLLTTGTYLWTYGNGGGQDTSISELGLHGQYADVWSTDMYWQDAKAVFFLLEGSHFGNWDHTDNIMRSVLAMPTMGLFVCCIAGHPQWYCHHMGLGEPIGYCARLTMNNSTLYQDTTNEFARAVYIALMGDPSLRADQVAPASGLSAGTSGGAVTLNWSASADGVAGYHVYRAPAPTGPFTRVTSALVTGTTYHDTTAPGGNSTYMVRAIALQANPSGSYFNPSQGIFISVNTSTNGTTPPNTPPRISSIAGQSILQNTSTPPIAFTIGDSETSASALTLQGNSSNPALVLNSGITFGGSGSNRNVTITPVTGQTGSANITISVSDQTDTTSTSFLLNVTSSDTNVVTGPFVPASAVYNGLFYESDQVRETSAGFFTVSTTARGGYSGRIQLDGRHYSFSGKFADQGAATNSVSRGHESPLTLELQAGTGAQAGQIFGRLTDGTWVANLSGDRATFKARINPAPWAGNYTLILPGVDGDPTLPAGDGYATVRISTGGAASMAVALADGTKVTLSAPLSKSGLWPVYASLYAGQGSLLGWLAFTNRADDDLNGMLNWIKPANSRARYYPAGFTEQIMAIGSVYSRPPGTNHILDLDTATISFSGGNLAADFTNNVSIGRSSRVTNLSANRLNLSFSPSTGRFGGGVTDPAGGKPLPFSGAVFQRLNSGYGFLPGTDQSSRVVIGP